VLFLFKLDGKFDAFSMLIYRTNLMLFNLP
jgi:hypothetical protein